MSHSQCKSGPQWEPYLAVKFAPLPVLTLFGRSAKGAEGGKPQDTMWYAMRDRFARGVERHA